MLHGAEPLLPVAQPQQRTGVALRQAIAVQRLHHRLLQPQQPQLVGHRRLAASQLFRRLLLAQAVAPQQPGDGLRLLHVVQIPPLEVLDQRQQRRVLLVYPRQQTRHLPQPGDPRRPPAALPRHQLYTPPCCRTVRGCKMP